ncbi:MAG: sugar phosphate nucleotidyltransferase [Candidatus Nealsonbacteria bacterium]
MNRKKITISIRDEMLKRVDRIIDRTSIRNRSHALEYLLSQALEPKINHALILAGGRGARMKPITEEIPKMLLPIAGKLLLEHQIELLRDSNIRDIVILLGHLGEKIKYHFGDGSRFGVKINYLEQKTKEIGTAYALNLAKNYFSSTPFLMMYGDVLAEINLKDFIDFHSSSGSLSTVALSSIEKTLPYGMVRLRGKNIVEFIEKPQKEGLSKVINAGIFCFEPGIFDYLSSKTNLSLEKDVFPKLAKEGKLTGYLFEGKWFDIGTPAIYEKAIKEWGR